MIEYLKGKVIFKNIKSVTLEIFDQFALNIFVTNENAFKLNESYQIYIWENILEDEINLYGFLDKTEREVFVNLLKIQGIGPKTSLNILRKNNFSNLVFLIKNEKYQELEKIKGIGSKATLIINELSKKMPKINEKINFNYPDVYYALCSLGYDSNKIFKALQKMPNNLTEQEIFKKAVEIIKNG